LQLAHYLGFEEVYLIGVDADYDLPKDTAAANEYGTAVLDMRSDDPNHFHPDYFGKGFRWHDPNVDRMVAAPSTADYGRLSVMLQYRFDMERLFRVPPGAFDPAPQVDSAIVRLLPRPTADLTVRDEAIFAKLVATAFGQRRKMLRNNLRDLFDEPGLVAVGIVPTARAEELAVADYIRMANALAK
jgi:hypothetical protein